MQPEHLGDALVTMAIWCPTPQSLEKTGGRFLWTAEAEIERSNGDKELVIVGGPYVSAADAQMASGDWWQATKEAGRVIKSPAMRIGQVVQVMSGNFDKGPYAGIITSKRAEDGIYSVHVLWPAGSKPVNQLEYGDVPAFEADDNRTRPHTYIHVMPDEEKSESSSPMHDIRTRLDRMETAVRAISGSVASKDELSALEVKITQILSDALRRVELMEG